MTTITLKYGDSQRMSSRPAMTLSTEQYLLFKDKLQDYLNLCGFESVIMFPDQILIKDTKGQFASLVAINLINAWLVKHADLFDFQLPNMMPFYVFDAQEPVDTRWQLSCSSMSHTAVLQAQ